MGAVTFTEYSEFTDLTEAFQEAVTHAQFEHGHSAYSGTIAAKDAHATISTDPIPMGDASRLAHQLIAEDDERITDKWGPAGAIRVRDGDHDGWLFFGWVPS